MDDWNPSDAETQVAMRSRDLLIDDPRAIRVLCPSGHFIAMVALTVNPEQSDNPPIMMRPRGPRQEYGGDLHAGPHGFRMTGYRTPEGSYRPRVKLHCRNSRCTYEGHFNYFRLSALLGAVALAGHREFRLTN